MHSRIIMALTAVSAVVAVALLVAVAVQSDDSDASMIEAEQLIPEHIRGRQQYEVVPGRKNPHPKTPVFAREFDPWARDGYTKRGSFTVERRVLHKMNDRFWLVASGKPGHTISCTVRMYKSWGGQDLFMNLKKTYTNSGAVMTELLPALSLGEHDTLTCTDMLSGERQYFTFDHFEKPEEQPVPASSTPIADEWMKKHGLDDFDMGPLFGTSGSMKDQWPGNPNDLSAGEKWLAKKGVPMINQRRYVEQQGYATDQDIEDSTPYKQDIKQYRKDLLRRLRNKRVPGHYRDNLDDGLDGAKHRGGAWARPGAGGVP